MYSFKPQLKSLLILAALASTTAAGAEQRMVSETRPLNAEARLSVNNTAGLIEVTAWDKPQLSIEGRLGEGVEKLEITGNPAEMRIEVKNRNSHFNNGDTTLRLQVPAGARLVLEGVSADVIVRGSRGAVEARTVSGDVHLEVAAKAITAKTVSGDLLLNAPQSQEVIATTVSGDMQVQGGGGSLVGESVSGEVNVQGGRYSRLELKSVSGDVFIHADTTADARVKAESLSGDVRFDAPASLSAEVTLKTFSGEKNCAFEGAIETETSRRSLVKRVGEGRGQVTLTSFSGDVELEKK